MFQSLRKHVLGSELWVTAASSGWAFRDGLVADPTPDLPDPDPALGLVPGLLCSRSHTALQHSITTPSWWLWPHKCPERATKRSVTCGWNQNCHCVIRKSEMDRKTVSFCFFNSSSIHYTTSCKMGAAQFPVSQPPPGTPVKLCFTVRLVCTGCVKSHEPLISSALLPVRGSLLRQWFRCCAQPSSSFTCEGF